MQPILGRVDDSLRRLCVVDLDLATREQLSADWPILQSSRARRVTRTLQSALRSRANSLRSARPKIGCTDNRQQQNFLLFHIIIFLLYSLQKKVAIYICFIF